MIRFSCPHCGRGYVLADAFAHLPLVCKGCGQRLNVPDPSPEPEPVLPPSPVKKPPAPRPVAPAPRPEPVKEVAPPEPPADGNNVPTTRPRPPVELNSEGLFESPANAALFSDSPEPPTAGKSAIPPTDVPTPPQPGRKLLPVVVDVLVALTLVWVGALAGEMLVKKSSGQILSESSTAPKFPPVELLMWLAGPVLAGLIYLWLGTRGWTVGGWLRRRSAA